MAIQGTQVPMYTNTHYFCIFQFFILWKQNKAKLKISKQKHVKQNKAMHESMIPKADKKSSKESPTLDRKN